MTTATAQINIPFDLLAEAVTTLNIEHKIKLRTKNFSMIVLFHCSHSQ